MPVSAPNRSARMSGFRAVDRTPDLSKLLNNGDGEFLARAEPLDASPGLITVTTSGVEQPPGEAAMGINAELVTLLTDLRAAGRLDGHSRVVELGAQEVSAAPEVVSRLLERAGLPARIAGTARDLYQAFGYQQYVAIDTGSQGGAVNLDLNMPVAAQGLCEVFDLVTNLGTTEHVFDQTAAFRNIHDLCREGGLMVHALPSQGLANHGFYNYHPRFVWELASANSYEIVGLYFTVDFRPKLNPYQAASFQQNEERDVLLYAVLLKATKQPFRLPSDRIFAEPDKVQASEFRSWIKTTWDHVGGHEALH